MPPTASLPLPLLAALGALLLVLLAETLHQRRCRVAARLATGPAGRPRRWVGAVAAVRAAALAAMAWALVTLYYHSGGGYRSQDRAEGQENRQHIVFVADLSPSMQLKDAGPGRDKTRAQRMHDVVDAILQRVGGDVIYTVMAFYTDAMPVILDAEDAELVRNVFDGLPIWYAMQPGKTDLGTGVRKSLEELSRYPKGSTTVFVCTDGDTVALGTIPKPPPAVSDVYVLGVGDPRQGTFIDGHHSRQDASELGTVAGRLRGQYIDVNEKHVSTLALGALATDAGAAKSNFGLVELAIIVMAVAAGVHALIPVMLELFGSDWKAVSRRQTAAAHASESSRRQTTAGGIAQPPFQSGEGATA
jgi:Ca-activated chloride channel homolog